MTHPRLMSHKPFDGYLSRTHSFSTFVYLNQSAVNIAAALVVLGGGGWSPVLSQIFPAKASQSSGADRLTIALGPVPGARIPEPKRFLCEKVWRVISP